MFNSNPRKSADNQKARHSDTSLIARGTSIRGDVEFFGALHLDGCIEGAVLAAEDSEAVFTLSAEGQVVGEVHVANAVINGEVKGNIVARGRLELAAQAYVEGDVHYKVLEMAAGARVNGRMVHQGEEPQRQLSGPDGASAGVEPEPDAVLAEG